jgi:ADP-heptose:LPS heptosyltransferase
VNTPVLGFYTSAKEKQEWLPYQVKNKIVMSQNNNPTSSIPIPLMIEAIDEFIREL